MNRRTEGRGRDPVEAAERFRALTNGWMVEDPSYDKEAWPELREGLDRNRAEYRKHFSNQAQDLSKAVEG